MNKRILITRKDNTLAIMVPCICINDPADFTEDQAVERCLRKDIPADVLNVQVVDVSAIPSDRYFRSAWKQNGSKIEIDMNAAREVARNRIRAKRKSELEVLDVEYIKALELGNQAKQKEIADRKQVLRDAPSDPRLESAMTPDELKAIVG